MGRRRRRSGGAATWQPELTGPWAPSIRRPLEISQVRRRLVALARHQHAVGAEEIVLLADQDMVIVLRAVPLEPDLPGVAPVGLGDGPWPGQRVVDGGDLVVQNAGVGAVEIDALLEDGRVV